MIFVIYGRPNCPWCDKAKSLLQERGLTFEYHDIYEEGLVDWIKAQGVKTVPQIYQVNRGEGLMNRAWFMKWIGGYENLVAHLQVEDANSSDAVYAGRVISD